jgi:hypothetical protein
MLRQEALLKREKSLQIKKNAKLEAKKKTKETVNVSYTGKNFAGLSMIKDKLIRPLLLATERVVEYYFPDDPKQEEPSRITPSNKRTHHFHFSERPSMGD